MEHMETRDSGRIPVGKVEHVSIPSIDVGHLIEKFGLPPVEPVAGHDMERIAAIDKEVEASWRAAENGGWHDSWNKLQRHIQNASALNESFGRTAEDERNWIVNKLMLVVSELAEAQDELRKGKGVTEVYYLTPDGSTCTVQVYDEDGVPQYKPEGFLVELADALIRIEDLVGIVTEGAPSFGKIKLDKIQFNGTRGTMHGGKKF